MLYQYSVNYAFFNVKLQFYLSLLCNILCEFTLLLLCNSIFRVCFILTYTTPLTTYPYTSYTLTTPPLHPLQLVTSQTDTNALKCLYYTPDASIHYTPQYISLYPHYTPLTPSLQQVTSQMDTNALKCMD